MKKTISIVLLLLSCWLITGCSLTGKERVISKTAIEPVTVTKDEINAMEKVANLVFDIEKDSFKNEELTEKKKAFIARGLQENYLNSTGTKMTEDFQKYFGKDQTVTFDDIPCGWDHGSEEENIMEIFDEEQDKYVYNEKHPGHGGGWKDVISFEMDLENVTVIGKEYHYDVKLFFYGDAGCQDIGPCYYGKAYKTYEDAKNKKNPMVEIDNNSSYVTQYSSSELPETHLDKVMKDIRENLNTYEFVFKKVDGNLVFQKYLKK